LAPARIASTARRVSVPHPSLQTAQSCPGCTSGKLYRQSEPSELVRITGMAPLMATVYANNGQTLLAPEYAAKAFALRDRVSEREQGECAPGGERPG